jgi:glycosyltransferase involved in cell wall biosynthesis
MSHPLVSIIIPTFNRLDLLLETLDSIRLQTHINWECILVDDGSTYETVTSIEDYCKKDKRFIYYSRPQTKPKGANACRNYGYSLCRGEFIKFFDSDDLMKPELLIKQMDFLLENSNLDFCATFWIHLYKDGHIMMNKQNTDNYKENPIKAYLLNSHIFPTPSPLWRRSFLEGKPLFNEDLCRSQEADFHFNMLMFKPKYDFVHDFLMYIRIGHDSIKTTINHKSKVSIFKYFDNVFNQVLNSQNKEKQLLLEYVFYRQSVNYYNLLIDSKSFKVKFKVFKQFFKKILEYSEKANLEKKVNLYLGTLLLFLFNKGYTFFYYPELNHRKN